jgi:hypothetical protein
MDPKTVAEALRQVLDGADFYGPKSATLRVTDEVAERELPNSPYSIATNTEHTVFWNRIWLARLKDEKRPDMKMDWRVPDKSEWGHIKRELTETVQEAHKIASAKPFRHAMKSDEAACKTLLAIAVHTAYHLGQISLLKRMDRKAGAKARPTPK